MIKPLAVRPMSVIGRARAELESLGSPPRQSPSRQSPLRRRKADAMAPLLDCYSDEHAKLALAAFGTLAELTRRPADSRAGEKHERSLAKLHANRFAVQPLRLQGQRLQSPRSICPPQASLTARRLLSPRGGPWRAASKPSWADDGDPCDTDNVGGALDGGGRRALGSDLSNPMLRSPDGTSSPRRCTHGERHALAPLGKWQAADLVASHPASHSHAGVCAARDEAPSEEEEVQGEELRQERPQQQLSAFDSIWAPRRSWSDSKALLDSEEVRHARLEAVWGRARSLGLDRLVIRLDDDGLADLDADGELDEVQEVRRVLLEHERVLVGVFEYYSSLDGAFDGTMGLNQFSRIVDDCGLASSTSRHCRKTDFDRVFIAVDAASVHAPKPPAAAVGAGRAAGPASVPAPGTAAPNRRKALSLDEFLLAVVTMATMRYVLERRTADVSEAVERHLVDDLLAGVEPAALHEPNDFRRAAAYTEEVSAVLAEHEASLRALYRAVAVRRGPSKELLSALGWQAFLRRLGLFGRDVTERDGALCFTWSRMAVADPYAAKGHLKETHLPFEGFLEGLCRLAVVKALPTDAEIESSHAGGAKQLLDELCTERPDEHERFLEGRRSMWRAAYEATGGPAGGAAFCALAPVAQPLCRALDHLIRVILATIEAETRGADDLLLTDKECELFFGKEFATQVEQRSR